MMANPDPRADAQDLWSDFIDLLDKRVRRGGEQEWLLTSMIMCISLMLHEEHGRNRGGLTTMIDIALDGGNGGNHS